MAYSFNRTIIILFLFLLTVGGIGLYIFTTDKEELLQESNISVEKTMDVEDVIEEKTIEPPVIEKKPKKEITVKDEPKKELPKPSQKVEPPVIEKVIPEQPVSIENLQVTQGLQNHIEIKWDKNTQAKYYKLYRSRYESWGYELLKELLDERYEDKDISLGRYYYYKVQPFSNEAGLVSQSKKGYAKLNAPTRLMASDGSKRSVLVSWDHSESKLLFDLYRSDMENNDFKLIASDIDEYYYKDTTAAVGILYSYRVRAKTKNFSSDFSDTDSGYIEVKRASRLKVSDGSSPYFIDLNWKSFGADYFKIYRADKPKGPYLMVADRVKENIYRDRNISNCKSYYYKIGAVKNGMSSSLSSIDSGYSKCGAYVETFSGTGYLGYKDGTVGKATYNRPTGIVYQNGFFYIADTFNHKIRIITPELKTLTLAGSGEAGSVDGVREKASFYRPSGIAIDKNATVYVAEVDNHLIRKISKDGKVSVLAGSGKSGDRDGYAEEALFNSPYGITIDKDSNLYVTELDSNKIKKITPEGMVTTFAGDGSKGNKDGSLKYASFDSPSGITIDENGVIYVCDTNNNTIRIIKDNEVRVLAGNSIGGDKDGNGVNASFNKPMAIAVDKKGDIYVADTGNHKIRIITGDGVVKTVAGSLKSGDKDGFEMEAKFFSPRGITFDQNNSVYVTDFHAHKIRKINITTK